MNNDERKMLTEWLGECWTDPGNPKNSNRTFATPDDMMACKDRLVELGIIDHFDAFIYGKWREWFEGPEGKFIYFWEWLIDPTRFCQLCADFLKEGNDEPGSREVLSDERRAKGQDIRHGWERFTYSRGLFM